MEVQAVARTGFIKGNRNGNAWIAAIRVAGLMLHIPWDAQTLFCTDDYPVYRKVLPPMQHQPGKNGTTTIESRNSRIRQYLARFHRKTKCYAKSEAVSHALLELLPFRKHIRTLVGS